MNVSMSINVLVSILIDPNQGLLPTKQKQKKKTSSTCLKYLNVVVSIMIDPNQGLLPAKQNKKLSKIIKSKKKYIYISIVVIGYREDSGLRSHVLYRSTQNMQCSVNSTLCTNQYVCTLNMNTEQRSSRSSYSA